MATVARPIAVTRPLSGERRKVRFAPYLLVLPAGIYFLALIGFPLVLGVWYSLTDVTVAREGVFVGLRHFLDATKDPTFRLAVPNTLITRVIATPAPIN